MTRAFPEARVAIGCAEHNSQYDNAKQEGADADALPAVLHRAPEQRDHCSGAELAGGQAGQAGTAGRRRRSRITR